MKKSYLFAMLLLFPFLFLGCDGNFGIMSLENTFLVIDNPNDSNIKLYCKSEKIGIASLENCEEILDEPWLSWAIENQLPYDNDHFKLFSIPSDLQIYDRNNVTVFFKAEIDEQEYTAELYIKSLREDGSRVSLFTEPVILKNKSGDSVSSIFTYIFSRSI